MEDWQKYIFDPKKPKGFKAYNLLKKLIKDGNTLLLTDVYYFNELYQSEIWTKDVVEELWDKPDNFEELSGNEKVKVYYDNFSENNYLELLDKKANQFDSSKLKHNKLFSNLSAGFVYSNRIIDINVINIKPYTNLSIDRIKKFKNIILNVSKKYTLPLSGGCFIFVKNIEKKVSLKHFISRLILEKVSVFFVDEDTFIAEGFQDEKFRNLHPIILKKDEDIHQLLDFLVRDMEQGEDKPSEIHQAETYIDEIEIDDYFSLEKIHLKNLKDKREIYLMGENGDGKTILLQAIALALRGNQNEGDVINIVKQNQQPNLSLVAKTSDGERYKYYENPKSQKTAFKAVLGYGIDRFRNDSDQKDEAGYLSLFNKETYLENPEKWLIHLDHKEAKGETSEISLSLAKEILKDILEKEVLIKVTPDKVTFTEKGTTLNFEQLSDGYQSVIIWVCDLIARMSKLQPMATGPSDYSGVVIVDEIGAYLHPKWAYELVQKLRSWFPKIQFIFTTHNPIVILGASAEAVFYKVYKENGKTKVTEPIHDISDLMLNSLVTSPLFNLPTARPLHAAENNDLSSDDYVYKRIHQTIQKKLQEIPNLVDSEIMEMLEIELAKI